MLRDPFNGKLPAEERHSLPDSQEPEGIQLKMFLLGNSPAVVLYLQNQEAPLLGQVDIYLAGMGVTHDVGRELLKDPEHRGRGPFIHIQVRRGGVESARDAGVVLKLRRLPFNGSRQTEMVQDIRPELGGDLANHLHGVVDAIFHGVHFL
jgi:hypothetical protein